MNFKTPPEHSCFVCDLCGQEKTGDIIDLELPDPADLDLENGEDFLICLDCLNKIWAFIGTLKVGK